MLGDFEGLKIIWPPGGTKPPKHEHDVVFVHGLHNGAMTDWQDETGVSWPAEHLSLDLRNARILAFGYNHQNLNLASDHLYEGGFVLNQAAELCRSLKNARRREKAQVPITLVGHGTGGILIKSALSFANSNKFQYGAILKKARHLLLLDTPRTSLTFAEWKRMSSGSLKENSIGAWKVWSAALTSSLKGFQEIAPRLNVTYALVGTGLCESDYNSGSSSLPSGQEKCITLDGVNNVTISKLTHGSGNYYLLLHRIREGLTCTTNDRKQIERLQTWLGRPSNKVCSQHYDRLNRHHHGTGLWMFEDKRFHDWARFDAPRPILWLTGPEGCGKSVLCSLASEWARQNDSKPAVVRLILEFDKPSSQYDHAVLIAGQLLDHVVATQGGADAEALFLPSGEGDKIIRVYHLIQILVSQCPRVFVFIDGLDELGLTKPMVLTHLPQQGAEVERLRQQLRSTIAFVSGLASAGSGSNVRLWISSRKVNEFKEIMLALEVVELPVDEHLVSNDVASYLDHTMNQTYGRTEPDFDVAKAITDAQTTAGSSFLMASLIVERMQRCALSSEYTISTYPFLVPNHVGALYHESLESILRDEKRHGSLLLIRILSLVTFARRPLKIEEVQEALSLVERSFEKDSGSEFHCTDLAVRYTKAVDGDEIRRRCAPFIVFVPCQMGDSKGYLRLSHSSVLRFLLESPAECSSEQDEPLIGPNLIADACLKYLSQRRYAAVLERIHMDESYRDHHFLLYALKYWHIHLDEAKPARIEEAKSFLLSPQFINMIRLQSLFLDQHFRYDHAGDNARLWPIATNIPACFDTRKDMKSMADNYRAFVREWSSLLQLGVTDSEAHGEIERCFWGALGQNNFLRRCGSILEGTRSFLLEMEGSESDKTGVVGPSRCIHESISDDGNRLAVWKLTVSSGEHSREPAHHEGVQLTREPWIIDGNRPPFRYGPQETFIINRHQAQWDSYESFRFHNISLIPIQDSSARVAALDECKYGSVVRVGRIAYTREKGGVWTAFGQDDYHDQSYWENIYLNDPWIIRSRRKQISVGLGVNSVFSECDAKQLVPQTPPSVERSGSSIIPDFDSQGLESEGLESLCASYTVISSAEEFCDPAASDSDSSAAAETYEHWPSRTEVDPSGSEDALASKTRRNSTSTSEDDDEADSLSDRSDGDTDWDSDNAPKIRNECSIPGFSAEKEVERTGFSDDSDADDEMASTTSGYESQSDSDPGVWHYFRGLLSCSVCNALIPDPSDVFSGNLNTCTWLQCIPCADRICYDICSTCFDKGAWCKDPTHLLSKGMLKFRDRRLVFQGWEDGISQNTAMPLLSIVAGYREREPGILDDKISVTDTFRYTRRHLNVLYESPPVVHPTLPLLVFPLDGREYLFGNLRDNTYFIHEVPFDPCETAETAGNTCIPISVSMRFSSCGKYLYLVRVTARNDSTIFSFANLFVMVWILRLCPKAECSAKPKNLFYRRGISLGARLKLVKELPYSITWSETCVYITLSGEFLKVFRILLQTGENHPNSPETGSPEVCILSNEIALPHSAQSRPVRFFPANGESEAKIVLGRSGGEHPQAPAVVYLDPEHMGYWVNWEPGRTLASLTPCRRRDDPRIQDPDADDYSQSTQVAESYTADCVLDKKNRNNIEQKFKKNGIYCPSCFELGLKFYIVLGNPSHVENVLPLNISDWDKFHLVWRVRIQSLIEALQAGCQFCCYVACELLTWNLWSDISQLIGNEGARCCARGLETIDPTSVQKAIRDLRMLWWARRGGPEEPTLNFVCEPLDQDSGSNVLRKITMSLPDLDFNQSPQSKARSYPSIIMSIRGDHKSGDDMAVAAFLPSGYKKQRIPECVLELYTLPDDPAHDIIPTRPMTTFRGGNDNLDVIKGWLEDCRLNHSFCQYTDRSHSPLPARLIMIVDGESAQIVDTDGQFGQYVALSYCWGPDPDDNNRTTIENVQTRHGPRGLLREDLPAVVRDALSVTERLKYKYIWVDALCIIQDSAIDRNRELAKMSQYYRNSHLTIAASTPRCTTGFIGQIGRCENHPDSALPRDLVPLDVWCRPRPSNDESVFSGKIYVRKENPYQSSQEPINKRAWTLQESLLSPRVLLFGSRVIWFCKHMTHSDGGVEDWSFDVNELERTRREFQIQLVKVEMQGLDQTPTVISKADNSERDDIYRLWHRIVSSYSRRAISHPEDKLTAISAVVAEIAQICNDDYLAGLWRSNLARDLLWSTPQPATTKSETWRAPSWSWASVVDPILYDGVPPEDAHLLAEIVRAQATPKTSTVPFGEVGFGELEITAPCISLERTASGEDWVENTKKWTSGFGMKSRDDTRRALMHEVLRLTPRDELGMFQKFKDEEYYLPDACVVAFFYGKEDDAVLSTEASFGRARDKHWILWGLILRPASTASRANTYERELAFSRIPQLIEGGESFFSESKRTVTIV